MFSLVFPRFLILLLLACSVGNSYAESPALSAEQRSKVEKYKVLLTFWASQPKVISATKMANRKPFSLSNIAWDRLDDKDPMVLKLGNSEIAKQLETWEKDSNIVKLNLRDIQGNLVAYSARSGKPLLFNNKSRSPFINGMKGSWSAEEVKPDPSTQQNSIQISTPVLDGTKAIGVLHSAVIIE